MSQVSSKHIFGKKGGRDSGESQSAVDRCLEFVRIGICQKWNLSELEFVRNGICQNWNLSELELVRIGICQNFKTGQIKS